MAGARSHSFPPDEYNNITAIEIEKCVSGNVCNYILPCSAGHMPSGSVWAVGDLCHGTVDG